jgi:GAF domain-containing protein
MKTQGTGDHRRALPGGLPPPRPLKIEDSRSAVWCARASHHDPHVLEEKQYRYPELARKTGLSSLLSVPMFTHDTVIGTINIYARAAQFAEDEIDFVKVVAGRRPLQLKTPASCRKP